MGWAFSEASAWSCHEPVHLRDRESSEGPRQSLVEATVQAHGEGARDEMLATQEAVVSTLEISVHRETEVYQTYRANRVRSLFNVEDERGARFDLDIKLEVGDDWQIGLVVGPSGTGKSSIGHHLVDGGGWRWWQPRWPKDRPIIEAITPKADMDVATGALAAVGLGDVPAWLRPYPVLSMGEQFRANLARLVAEGGDHVVVDEFTSVVDRQIAKIGSMAFAKAHRRGGGQVILLSCHHDIIEWLEPDWCYDTGSKESWFPKVQGSSAQRLTSTSKKQGGNTGSYSNRITI